jgi:hypothetical protein
VLEHLPRITQALICVLAEALPDGPDVTPLPPDRLKGNAIGLYLYGLQASHHLRNTPPGATARPPRPSYELSYTLTAHSDVRHGEGTLCEQAWLGVAAAAMQRHAVIDKRTKVKDGAIFDLVGLAEPNLTLRISPDEPPAEQRFAFWSATGVPLRLAIWYTVHAVVGRGSSGPRIKTKRREST